MLNAPVEDWPRFIERDQVRKNLDKDGAPATFDDLLRMAPADIADKITPEAMATRHAAAMENLQRIRDAIASANLDALIVIGDDQNELHNPKNLPCILIYHGKTIRNVPLANADSNWGARMTSKYYEAETPRDYPVDSKLAHHMIGSLIDDEFDIACANGLEPGKGEGHAFGFVHNRLLKGVDLPIVPVFLNTYFPPNQASPRRCYRLGQAIFAAVASYPSDTRIGIIASGGLSHFTIDEELDQMVLRALREKDAETLQNIPRNKLNSGSSEIRNWLCAAGALEQLPLNFTDYQPGYRTMAGTGTGMAFAIWS
ncbi:MAG: extradiol ring-cleavage dioxygenase [Alphaproteobacteria bacterium]|nr:extradiol ring-cleavage dioxygenase [Alphaproteobacteria bacterium]